MATTKLQHLIVESRKSRGMRPSDLAAAVGISRQYLNDIEHGSRAVSRIATLEKFAIALEVPPARLIEAMVQDRLGTRYTAAVTENALYVHFAE